MTTCPDHLNNEAPLATLKPPAHIAPSSSSESVVVVVTFPKLTPPHPPTLQVLQVETKGFLFTEEACDRYLNVCGVGERVKTWKYRDLYFAYTSTGYRNIAMTLIVGHMVFCIWEVPWYNSVDDSQYFTTYSDGLLLVNG